MDKILELLRSAKIAVSELTIKATEENAGMILLAQQNISEAVRLLKEVSSDGN